MTPAPLEAAPEAENSRKVKLILPRFQLQLVGLFAALATLALTLQYLVFCAAIAQASARLPNDSVLLMEGMQALLLKVLGLSMGILAPVLFWAGILATHRIAGPIYRFHRYLDSVARGERPADCKLRSGDQLQSLCDLINESTRPVREGTVRELDADADTNEELRAA